MQLGKKSITAILCLFICVMLTNRVQAGKSVYVISNTNGKEIQAYKVNGSSLTYQTDYDTTHTYPVGLAIHESEYGKWLFCTFEFLDNIELIDAQRMEIEDSIDVPYASNLAGVVMDTGNSKLYAVDRYTNHLYSYSWDPSTKTLTPDFSDPYYVELADIVTGGGKGAFGISLDEENGLLYVADNTTNIKYYDTSDWSKEGQIEVSCEVIGIAVDVTNQFLYYGSMYSYGQGDPNLYQYDISSSTEDVTTVGSSVAGIAVDQQTGLAYITTYSDGASATRDRLIVYDVNLTQHWVSNQLGSPAGLTVAKVGFKDPFFNIAKDDNDVDCVYPLISEIEHELLGTPYNWLYYNIAWDANGYADSNVVVVDHLPKEVDEPNLISGGGVYDSNEHTVTWTIGNVAANDSDEYQIRVGVNNWARPGGVITNKVEIEGDEYLNWHIIDTNVCAWGSEIIYVDKDANGYNNGTSWNDAYNLLQDGFTGARNCCAAVTAIWVAAGTYKPIWDTNDMTMNETFELIEDVGLFGHFGGVGTYETSTTQRNFADPNNETILDGQSGEGYYESVHYVLYGQGIEDAIVDGFTITGAYYDGIYFDDCDGSVVNCKIKNNDRYGIQCHNYSYPDIHNSIFMGNSSQGIRVYNHCWPEVSYCTFDGNDTTYQGISQSNYSVLVIDNSLFKNHTSYGVSGSGGTLTVSDSDFENNQYGFDLSDVTTTLTNSVVKTSDYTGIDISNCDLTVDHSIISHNGDNGIYASSGSNLTVKNSVVRYSGEHGIELHDNLVTTIKNNWIHNNGTEEYAYYGGSGICFNGQSSVPLIRNNTIYDNWTYGLQSSGNGADPNVINCIIYGNDSNDFYRENGTFDTVNYCCLQNSHPGRGNITGDPGFKNIGTDPNDLHLDETSQCNDAGDPNGDYGDETDIDGENRIRYGRVDIGADEYYYSPADFDESGNVSFVDYAMFAGVWRTTPNDINDYDDVFDLQDNNSIDYKDLKLFCEDWLWEVAFEDNQWMMCMGGGGFGGLESGELMILDAKTSLATRPERLTTKSEKFYAINAFNTVSALQKAEQAKEVDIKKLIEWLDEIWLSGELKETMTEEQYMEFRKSIEESE